MKSGGMSGKDRRAVLMGLIVLGPALFYVWPVKPYLAAVAETRNRMAVGRDLLSREKAAISAARLNPGLQSLADSAMRATSPRLFHGRDDVASADLITTLSDIARQNEVFVSENFALKRVTDPSGVVILRAEVRGESDLQGVLAFLESIEHGDKLLRVESLDIGRQMAKADAEGVQPVSIKVVIAGYAIHETGVSDLRPPAAVKSGRGAE